MPTIKTDHKLNLDSLSDSFGNSDSKRLYGSKNQLASSGGVTGWLRQKVTSKNSSDAQHAAAVQQLIWAYKQSTFDQFPSKELETRIKAAVKGGESMKSLLAAMKEESEKYKASLHRSDCIQAAAEARTPEEIMDAYQKLVAPRQEGEPAVDTFQGKHLLQAIQKNPHLSPEEKQQVICDIAKDASRRACLASTNGGNLARHNDAGTNFLTACSQQYLDSVSQSVAKVVERSVKHRDLKMPDGVSPPNPGTQNPHGLSQRQADAYDNACIECAVEVINTAQQAAQHISPQARQYLTAVKEGAVEAALEKPDLQRDAGASLTPDQVGDRMVQGQVMLRVVNPSITNVAGWKAAQPSAVENAQAAVLNKLPVIPQTFDNYSGGEGPSPKPQDDGSMQFDKAQDRIVARMREENPDLNETYKQLAGQITEPVDLLAIEERVEQRKAQQQQHVEIDDDELEIQPVVEEKVEKEIEIEGDDLVIGPAAEQKAEKEVGMDDQQQSVDADSQSVLQASGLKKVGSSSGLGQSQDQISISEAEELPSAQNSNAESEDVEKPDSVKVKAAMFERLAQQNAPTPQPSINKPKAGGIGHN